jgi:hypothetical protein
LDDPDEERSAMPINIDVHQNSTSDGFDAEFEPEDNPSMSNEHPEDADMSDGELDPKPPFPKPLFPHLSFPDTLPAPVTEPTSEPNGRRLNIASLCNPNEEVTEIRQPQSSSLFDLDAVHKPAWIKDSSCEQYLFAHYTHLLTVHVHLAEFKVLLNGLTDDSIDRAIACFKEGFYSRKVLPGDFDSRRAQLNCHSILQMTERGSTATSMVCDIPKFWINLGGLTHSSNLTAIESTMTHVFCMQGALKFHYWLLDIIPAAIIRTSKAAHKPKLWIDKLVTDIRSSLDKGGSATFQSSKYLENLVFPREYRMKPYPFQYNKTEILTSVISSTLRCWLGFPTDENSLAQLSLLEIVLSKCPNSILFLDKIWEMYATPFSTVFNNDWDVRKSKKKLITALADFEKVFALHPFAITDSVSHQKLQYLSQLINEWLMYISVNSNTAEKVSRIEFIMLDPS